MTDSAVTLFPHPDSPTSATACPFGTLKETLSTAWTSPCSEGNEVRRFLTSRMASRGSTSRSAIAASGLPTGCWGTVTPPIVARATPRYHRWVEDDAAVPTQDGQQAGDP